MDINVPIREINDIFEKYGLGVIAYGEPIHSYVIKLRDAFKKLSDRIDTLERLRCKELPPWASKEDRIIDIENHFRSIMDTLNVVWDDSTKDTPRRVAKMFINELFYGMNKENYPKVTTQANSFSYDQMLVETNIKVHSTCEHHFVPILGECHIGYIPKDKIIGLSKFNRIVDYWARRPQVQERLTEQISRDLIRVLDTEDIAVVIDASHLCVKVRGIKDEYTKTRTSSIHGVFRENLAVRQEFFDSIPRIRAKY